MNRLKLRHCHPIYLRVDVDDAGRPLPRDIHCTASGDIRIALTGSFRRWRFVSSRNTKTLFTLLTFEIFGTARTVYCIRGAGYMQLSGVRPSVCLSVCLSHLTAARCSCGFAAVGPAARRYRSIAARPAVSCSHAAARRAASSATLSAKGLDRTQTCLKLF